MAIGHSMRGCHCRECERHRDYMREYQRRRASDQPKRPRRVRRTVVAHETRVLIEQRIALGWSDDGIAQALDCPPADVATVRHRMDELVGA